MSNPIPLMDPYGMTWAYQCGYCRMIHCEDTSAWVVRHPRPEKIAFALSQASKCCMCDCGQIIEAPTLSDSKPLADECEACLSKTKKSSHVRRPKRP